MKHIIEQFSGTDFDYGVSDCCQFVGKAVEHFTGNNPVDDFAYANEAEALKLIDGYGSLFDLICSKFGDPIDNPQDGDIALLEQADSQIAGILYGSMVWAKTKSGICGFPLKDIRFFWKIK